MPKATKQPVVTEYCIRHGNGIFVDSLEGLTCMSCQLPDDYEACGECGFDHAYEYESAYSFHKKTLTECGVETSDGAVIVPI